MTAREYVEPTSTVAVDAADIVTVWFTTVTVHVSVKPPTFVVTVITAVPADTPVIIPVLSTTAMPVLLELQLTVLSGALFGVTVAVRISEYPTVNVVMLLLRVTPETVLVTVTGTVNVSVTGM